mgnify:CR=1 FL=1
MSNVEQVKGLFRILQKYKFESKSQPGATCMVKKIGCLEYYKNTNLKANHNDLKLRASLANAV